MKYAKWLNALLLSLLAAGALPAQTPPGDAPQSCAPGMHAELAAPLPDPGGPDGPGAQPGDYRCVADMPAPDLSCGSHGQPLGGSPGLCLCDAGYAGAACDRCAAGHARDASGACAAEPADRNLLILGAERTLAYGSSTTLQAERLDAAGQPVTGRWELRGDAATAGCLAPPERPDGCLAALSGSAAVYRAPAQGQGLQLHALRFTPADGAPVLELALRTSELGDMPINGYAAGGTQPVVKRFSDFMKARCAGAGSLGIAVDGKVVVALGLGMKNGRNAETVYNTECSDNSIDPFDSQAEEMNFDTPFMIGSISKSMTYAATRWVLKRALAAQDPDVRLITLDDQHVVSALRNPWHGLLLTLWKVHADGSLTSTGFGNVPTAGSFLNRRAKDFHLVPMSGSRFVLALRNDDDRLHLITYRYNASVQVPLQITDERVSSGEYKQGMLAAVDGERVVAGLRLANDRLRLVSYQLTSGHQLWQRDLEDGGSLRDLRLTALPGSSRVLGAARLSYPDVTKFIVWDVAADGSLARVHETTLSYRYSGNVRLQLTALHGGLVVIGAQQGAAGALQLTTVAVAGDGTLSVQGSTSIGDVHDFRLTALHSSRFAVLARNGNHAATLQQFQLGPQSQPQLLGVRTPAGQASSLDTSTFSSGGWGLGLVSATRDAADTLRLTSWKVDPNTALLQLGTADAAYKVKDHNWNDGDVEKLSLTGFDLPNALLAPRLHRILAGVDAPPAHFDALDKDGNVVCSPADHPGYPLAEPGWKNIRLRQLFGHRSGQNHGAPSDRRVMTTGLGQMRGLASAQDWLAEENLLRQQWDPVSVAQARVAAGLSPVVNDGAPDGFLLPAVTLEELMVGAAGSCLPHAQDSYHYSNTDTQWLRMAMEHVTGQRYVAPVGQPGATAGTILDDFTRSELGFGSDGRKNIFARPGAPDAGGNDPFAGARQRHWHASGTYYPRYWDVKRPVCDWSGGSCAVRDPGSGSSPNWMGTVEKVPLLMNTNGEGAATGGLGVQIVPYLKFLSRFWVGGYQDEKPADTYNPFIGERRGGGTGTMWHNGGEDGTWAYAMQYNDVCDNGRNVDVITSVNQWSDAECGDDCDESHAMPYDQLKALIDEVICDVNWTQVKPIPVLND